MKNKQTFEIFKKGSEFQVIKIDFSDKKVIEKINEINKKQEEILKRKVVDVDKLRVVVQL